MGNQAVIISMTNWHVCTLRFHIITQVTYELRHRPIFISIGVTTGYAAIEILETS